MSLNRSNFFLILFFYLSLFSNLSLSDNQFLIGNHLNILEEIRKASYSIKGEKPTRINYSKLAESHRSYSDIITDGSDEIFIQARTAFQVVYSSSEIMIDSGMDEAIHNYFGFGRIEPYWQSKNNEIQKALKQASLIVITHEHADHIAGVLNSNIANHISNKTILTQAQAKTLISNPQMPEIKLDPEDLDKYLLVDYDKLMPLAPGIVLIKSPGHTDGHQMIYVSLESEKEYLFIGDIAWSIENIKQLKLRPEKTRQRINEDPKSLMNQMVWIKDLMDEQNIIIIPSHDNKLIEEYAMKGIIYEGLKIN
ncbi:MAG: hypothetical protein CBC38_02615 [Gammaproteobacteria bacterium TMED78]|nr:MAG: hypothetical protein CBC38_02615 [Gammaproteobacteria bacterium TMED78]|tara:strand:- start:109534 stop:110460 length:927 start_codon:yes stop_codon:yes gene_type:complete